MKPIDGSGDGALAGQVFERLVRLAAGTFVAAAQQTKLNEGTLRRFARGKSRPSEKTVLIIEAWLRERLGDRYPPHTMGKLWYPDWDNPTVGAGGDPSLSSAPPAGAAGADADADADADASDDPGPQRKEEEPQGKATANGPAEVQPGRVRRRQRRMVGLALILAVVLVGATILLVSRDKTALSADQVRGRVVCGNGAEVVGVWVEAQSGGSGWASWERAANSSSDASFGYTLPSGGRYQVHVGCGGTSERWQSNNKSAYVRGDKTFTCLEPPADSANGASCRVS